MKRWHLPAAELPVTLRPFGGETVLSYTRRLSEANDLPPNAVLRALGEVRVPGSSLLLRYDAALNDAAIDRLETLTAIPRARLTAALPGLNNEDYRSILPDDRPALRCFPPYSIPAPACSRCVTRRATTSALVYASPWRRVCRTHRRWLPGLQVDLSPAPAVLAAHHDYRQFMRSHKHQAIAHVTADAAMLITRQLAHGSASAHPKLTARWQARAVRLGLESQPTHPAVLLPEAVALARIFADPTWRRHAAMAERWGMFPLYQHIAAKTGADTGTLDREWLRGPLGYWLHLNRERYQHIRDRHTLHKRVIWYAPSNYPPVAEFTLQAAASRT